MADSLDLTGNTASQVPDNHSRNTSQPFPGKKNTIDGTFDHQLPNL
jgi:hypothetical protein